VLLLMHRLSSSCLFRNARRVERTRPGVVRYAVVLAARSIPQHSCAPALLCAHAMGWPGARAAYTRLTANATTLTTTVRAPALPSRAPHAHPRPQTCGHSGPAPCS